MRKRFATLPSVFCLAAFFIITSTAQALTVILDFNDPAQANTSDIFGNTVGTFDLIPYDLVEADRATLYNSIFNEVINDYYGIVSSDVNPLSPLAPGFELDIDFEIGDIGTPPVNGDAEYYYAQIGDAVSGPHTGSLGVAGGDVIRNVLGNGPNFGFAVGGVLGSIFTSTIQVLNASGLFQATHAVAGTLSHEIGHALSLDHMNVVGAVTQTGLNPIMGTGAIDLANAARLVDREFSISGQNAQNGGATQTHVAQLIGAIGLRAVVAVPEPSTALPLLLLLGVLTLRRMRR
jgi:hypothetical protein